MEATDAANTGKAADITNGVKSGASNIGFRPTHNVPGRSDNPIMNVEPPRREDLQPSYAQTLVADDAASHGWYGKMSMSLPVLLAAAGEEFLFFWGAWTK
jgi:hypothetical protein